MTRLPVTGAFSVTAVYGQQGTSWKNGHQGIDFTAPDRRVFCSCEGTVRLVSYDPDGWGQYVSVGDRDGKRHIFCHLVQGSVKVKAGDRVTPLTVLGTMGNTGNSTGVHLHFQLQEGERVIDPTPYLGIPNRKGSYHSKDFEEEQPMAYKDQATIPDWAKEAVDFVTEKGWMLGDEKGNFNPNVPMTRAELAVVLMRLEKE